MFNTSILDVAIGMVFIYLLLSLLCTATNELIELLMKKRATDLERGIRELLQPGSDSGTAGIVKDIYDHPLVSGLYGGTYEDSGIRGGLRYVKRTQLPSYIPARNFALALIDTVMPDASTTAAGADPVSNLRARLQNIENPRVQKALMSAGRFRCGRRRARKSKYRRLVQQFNGSSVGMVQATFAHNRPGARSTRGDGRQCRFSVNGKEAGIRPGIA